MRGTQNVFICSGLVENKLISSPYFTLTKDEASKNYELEFKNKPEIILGPFLSVKEKKKKKIESQSIKFSGQSKEAYYNDWLVNALILQDPKDCAFLLFDKRIDDKKMKKPTGTFIVRLEELKII